MIAWDELGMVRGFPQCTHEVVRPFRNLHQAQCDNGAMIVKCAEQLIVSGTCGAPTADISQPRLDCVDVDGAVMMVVIAVTVVMMTSVTVLMDMDDT